MQIPLNCIQEEKPGKKWQDNFNKTWPFYKEWFLTEGHFARKGYMESAEKLKHFMPELYPLYKELTELSGGGDLEARFLSIYCPPPYMTGCSQLAWTKETVALIRNYDYNPHLFEGVMFSTNWLKPVIGIADCNWGLLDGMNADGLTASLAFGGRQVVGEGFGIPLIIRYILETCVSVEQALEKLKTIPVHMSYNITLADSNYEFATVYLAPDRKIEITKDPISVNHQKKIEWKEYAAITATKERKEFLETALRNPYHNSETILSTFFQAPLYCNNFEKNFATLYTTVYKPIEKTVAIHWPEKSIFQSFTNFTEQTSIIDINTTVNS
jgi:predicted choloylglycine hydrolase